jgi:hypothetical protein
MPSVMDAPELIEYVETHDLTIETIERPQPHRSRPGVWRTLVHKLARYLTPTPHESHASVCHMRRPCETPAELLARQYPSLYVRACSGI